MEPNTPTFVLSLIGTLTGTAGVVLSILNYLRDRAKVRVLLQWDFRPIGPNNQPIGKPMGVVTIANIGRRPVYMKLVYLEVPKRSGGGPLILKHSLNGQRVAEGDPEYVIPMSSELQDFLQSKYSIYWKEIYAVASDNCGRKFKSSTPKQIPSWGKPKRPMNGQFASE